MSHHLWLGAIPWSGHAMCPLATGMSTGYRLDTKCRNPGISPNHDAYSMSHRMCVLVYVSDDHRIWFSTKLLQQYQKKLPNQQASSSSSAISTPRKSTSETRENRKNRNRESRASRRRSISTDEEIDEGRDPLTRTGRSKIENLGPDSGSTRFWKSRPNSDWPVSGPGSPWIPECRWRERRKRKWTEKEFKKFKKQMFKYSTKITVFQVGIFGPSVSLDRYCVHWWISGLIFDF